MEKEKETKTLEEKKEKVEETKKNSLTGIIIAAVLVLMVLCLMGGYFISESGIIGKKDTSKEKQTTEVTEEPTKEKTVTNYEVTDEKVSNLINHLLSIGIGRSCGSIEKYATSQKVSATDLDVLTIYHVAERWEFFNKTDSFTLDEMNTAIKKYFYGDISFDPTSIDYQGASCPQFNYDSNTKTFRKQETACGGTCGPASAYKIVKAVDTDGTLVLDVKVIFENEDTYYSDPQKTKKIDTSDGYDQDTLLNKGADYQFIFKLVDGNYAFVSSEPIK